MTRRKRVKILVEVNLDRMPGWGYEAEDFATHIRKYLEQTIPHYEPSAQVLTKENEQAMLEYYGATYSPEEI